MLYVQTPTNDVIEGENQFKVSHSTLLRNANYYTSNNDPLKLLESGEAQVPVFGAGGVTIIFNGVVPILMESCLIQSNKGDIGGGILALCIEHASDKLVPALVLTGQDDFHVFQNEVRKTSHYGKGAGVAIYIMPSLDVPRASICILFDHLVIVSNTNAEYGGGIYMYVSIFQVAVDARFSGITFFNNMAAVDGSTMFIMVNKRCIHCNNSLNVNITGGLQEPKEFNSKTFVLSSFTKSLLKFVNVDRVSISGFRMFNNHGSAIVLSNTILITSGDIYLQGNVAKTGSVIHLIGSSQIHFFSPVTFFLLDNEVSAPSGLITIDNSNDIILCPFVSLNSDENSTNAMVLINTSYTLTGLHTGTYNIYGDLRDCSEEWLKSILYYSVNGQSKSALNKVSSPPNKLCICGTNGTCIQTDTYQHMSYPGKANYIPMFAPDYRGKPTYVKLTVEQFHKHHCVVFNQTADIVLNGGTCTDVPLKLLQRCSNRNLVLLHFFAPSFSHEYGLSITTTSCPPGFILNTIIGVCVCHSLIPLVDLAACDVGTGRIEIKYGAWLGSVQVQGGEEDSLSFGYAPVCPTDYCTPGVTSVDMTTVDYLCQGHRTGMLCGAWIQYGAGKRILSTLHFKCLAFDDHYICCGRNSASLDTAVPAYDYLQ